MIKNLIAFILLLNFCNLSFSQKNVSIDAILEKIEKRITSYGTFEAKFEINGEISSITVKDNKFKINSADIITWYNGKIQWSYIKENEEVNITEPDESELCSINPYLFLKNWKNNFIRSNEGYSTIDGYKVLKIRLTPVHLLDYKYIFIYSDMNNDLRKIEIITSENDRYDIKISQLNKNINVQNTFFEFNNKEYKNVQIIDLR